MKVIIDTPTEEEQKTVFHFFKIFCEEQLQEFKLEIEGTELKHEQKKQ